MYLQEAITVLVEGKKVKLPEWTGYWFIPEDKFRLNDYNIYAENDAKGTTGSVDGATFANTVNGIYTGPYAVFTLALNNYTDEGKTSNIDVSDSLYIHHDAAAVLVIKKDATIPYAHHIYVAPYNANYIINIYAKQPMAPSRVKVTGGYTEFTSDPKQTEWETIGIKEIRVLTKSGDILDTPWLEKYKDRDDFEITEGDLGFDFAILALKNGKKIARKSWSPAKSEIWMFPVTTPLFIQNMHIIPEVAPFIGVVDRFKHLNVGWNPSSDDMLAIDWMLYEG